MSRSAEQPASEELKRAVAAAKYLAASTCRTHYLIQTRYAHDGGEAWLATPDGRRKGEASYHVEPDGKVYLPYTRGLSDRAQIAVCDGDRHPTWPGRRKPDFTAVPPLDPEEHTFVLGSLLNGVRGIQCQDCGAWVGTCDGDHDPYRYDGMTTRLAASRFPESRIAILAHKCD